MVTNTQICLGRGAFVAILTFQIGEGQITAFDADGGSVSYELLFGRGNGQVHANEVWERIRRIRAVERDEAVSLTDFLLKAGVLSRFRSRMSPEDWGRLLDALPVPVEA